MFLGAAMRIPSLLQIEGECCAGSLAKRIGPISDDTFGYLLERQSAEPVFALGCEMKTETQFFHRIVVVALVSAAFPVPLGLRFQKYGEAELPCALALLEDLVAQLRRRFLDVLVGDALYLKSHFVQQLESLRLDGLSR